MRAIDSSKNFARFEVFAGLYETVCLGCHRLLGVSQNMKKLEIVEHAHKCSCGMTPTKGPSGTSVRAA